MDEVDAPDVVGVLRSQPDDRAVLVIKPFAFLVAGRKLKAFFAPQALNFLVIDVPAFDLKKLCYLPISISSVLLGEADQRQP